MTRDAWTFRRALIASLLLHGVLLVAFMTLPGGGPAEPVQIYTVRIMEAPARPQARELTLSTEAISALKLEAPSLSTEAPALPEPETADVPALERFPAPERPPTAAPPSLTPAAPAEPGAPPELRPPSGPPQPGARELPSLPQAPPPPTPPPAAPRAPEPPRAFAPGPPLPPEAPARPSAMEQLRSKVRSLNLQVETETEAARQTPGPPAPTRERNVLSLRVYANRVREAVKEQYTFPGGFDARLRTRVRVVLNRDGSVLSTELLESSGNDRFDRLVCLAAFNKARIPAVPRNLEVEGETLTLLFTCSP